MTAFRKQWVGILLPRNHSKINAVKGGSEQRVGRPLPWGMLTHMGSALGYRRGNGVDRIGAHQSLGFRGNRCTVYCLKKGEILSGRGGAAVGAENSTGVHTVEVKAKGSKGNQERRSIGVASSQPGCGGCQVWTREQGTNSV